MRRRELIVKGHGPVDAMEYPRFSGIRTFMRLPQLQELHNVDFAVIGIPFDTGATYRVGARFGPERINGSWSRSLSRVDCLLIGVFLFRQRSWAVRAFAMDARIGGEQRK